MRPVITSEAEAMVRWAQGVLKGQDGKPHGTAEALDWLLRDACEYGSPVVGAQARKVWPESVEASEYRRKHPTVDEFLNLFAGTDPNGLPVVDDGSWRAPLSGSQDGRA